MSVQRTEALKGAHQLARDTSLPYNMLPLIRPSGLAEEERHSVSLSCYPLSGLAEEEGHSVSIRRVPSLFSHPSSAGRRRSSLGLALPLSSAATPEHTRGLIHHLRVRRTDSTRAVAEATTTAVVVVDSTGEADRCAVHSTTGEPPYCVVECRSRKRREHDECRGVGVAPANGFELINDAGAPGIQSTCVLHHHSEAAVAGSLDPRCLDDAGDVAVGVEISWSKPLLFREDTLDSKLGKQLEHQQQNLGQGRRESRTSLEPLN
ncbi:hypothetical protein THAOC_31585 [Thalassiosira oceanica]|uniref:Uncharacterized protein n=1 Tax=Thalassiosira oceanica TaxID=159749 RepID=K0RS75_THAOC|nr:hypothetical protein THAOC_31585 [Thalassiosira oceanica]|eukprot:EJK49532.1 hypothetical protein THAOC_31585 [Thalassiosira oceanica]